VFDHFKNESPKNTKAASANQLIRGLMEPIVPLLAHPQDRRSAQQHAQQTAVMEQSLILHTIPATWIEINQNALTTIEVRPQKPLSA
jgi:hypothetical protein